jgi:hypothetical protein
VAKFFPRLGVAVTDSALPALSAHPDNSARYMMLESIALILRLSRARSSSRLTSTDLTTQFSAEQRTNCPNASDLVDPDLIIVPLY